MEVKGFLKKIMAMVKATKTKIKKILFIDEYITAPPLLLTFLSFIWYLFYLMNNLIITVSNRYFIAYIHIIKGFFDMMGRTGRKDGR